MLKDVIKKLESLGCVVQVSDEPLVNMCLEKAQNHILRECNLSEVPAGLMYVIVDMAVGEYLFLMRGAGKLTGFDFEAAVKQINEGDTSVTFELGKTPEQRLDLLISHLMKPNRDIFAPFRRMKW